MKRRGFIGSLIPIIIGLLVTIALKTYVLINVVVPTGSMEPTIMSGDRLIGSKLSYRLGEPARGDVITFSDPDGSTSVFVKRIIGLPGETVTIVAGKVYVDNNENPLSEPYVNQEDVPEGDFGPYVVPENSYFVLGDNRNLSKDSRYWETTNYVKRENITSKILFRYFPELKTLD